MGSSEEARAEALSAAEAAGQALEAEARRERKKAPPRSKAPLRLAAVAVVATIAAFWGVRAYRAAIAGPVITTYQPDPVEPGRNLTVSGYTFPDDASRTIVRFEGAETTASTASPDRINVTVPESLGARGSRIVGMTVISEGKSSLVRLVRIDATPRIEALTPRVAWTGDEIELSGRWLRSADAEPEVTIAGVAAEVVSASPTRVRARVPDVDALEGRTLPVRVSVSGESSREAGLLFGRLPFLESVEPARVEPGDEFRLSGAGLDADGLTVEVGGREALVLERSPERLVAVAPGFGVLGPGGARGVRVRSGDRTSVQREIDVRRESSTVFIPRFFVDLPPSETPRARVATDVSPIAVLRSAGPADVMRAHRAAQALNALAESTRDGRVAFEARETAIVAGGAVVLSVLPGDGSGDPRATATLWAAALTDVFDLFLSGRRATRTIEVSGDGQVFLDLHALARRRGAALIPSSLLATPDPSWTRAFEAIARGAAARPRPERAIEGVWSGSMEAEGRPPLPLEFRFSSGTDGLAGERSSRGGRASTALARLSYARREVRFSFLEAGAEWSFRGSLDGDAIEGEARPASGRPARLVLRLAR